MNKQTDTFNFIYTEYHHKFIRFAFSYVHNREVAEDIVTECMIYYWERRIKLKEVENVPLYILVSIKNKCLDFLKRQQTWENVSDQLLSNSQWELKMRISNLEACNPEALFTKEVQEILNKALQKLPEKSRHIFEMSRNEGKTNQAIANEIGLSLKSIEFHISKVLKVLRDDLKDYMPLLILVFDVFYA